MEFRSFCEYCHRTAGETTPCGLCLVSLCDNCIVQESVRLYSAQMPGESHVCKNCYGKVLHLESVLQEEQLAWGRMSPRGERWFTLSGAAQLASEKSESISSYLKLVANESDLEMLQKDVYNGRTDPNTFHWEYSEVLLRICDLRSAKDNYRDSVCRVLKAYCCRNGGTGYCQGLNFVAAWLLMFMDENAAFWMMTKLVESTLLPGFYSGERTGNSLNGFYIESGVVASFLESCNPAVQRSGTSAMEFADFFCLQLLIQLFVDSVDFSSAMFLWDCIAAEGSIALIRGSLAIIEMLQSQIESGEHPVLILKSLSDKSLSLNIQAKYCEVSLQATTTRVTRLRSQVRTARAKQWKEDDIYVFKQLERASHFSRDEIKEFQKAFNQFMEQKKGTRTRKASTARVGYSHQSVRIPLVMQSGSSQSEDLDAGISKCEFITLVQRFSNNTFAFASQLFDRYDEDRNGYLDFRELLVCLSLMSKGSFEERLRVCYDLFDYDHSGYLSSEELSRLVESINRHLQRNSSHQAADKALAPVREKFECLLGADCLLSWREFYHCVLNDRVVYSIFAQHLISDPDNHYSSEKLLEAVAGTQRQTKSQLPPTTVQTRCQHCCSAF